ncbi:hypothetical protein EFL26_21940 [Nocardioides pocheonensis]|uniref:Uncharacterized protein n=1 Tax=Nocardioides pocheonensis TaxID=661485 RepID=A0A3N0GHA2_9ACTN|nr:hypothetical protein EFL26_21940 [Nocardioides pocheonensis]
MEGHLDFLAGLNPTRLVSRSGEVAQEADDWILLVAGRLPNGEVDVRQVPELAQHREVEFCVRGGRTPDDFDLLDG